MSDTRLVTLTLDRDACGQLTTALELHRRAVVERNGGTCAPTLVDVEHVARELWHDGGELALVAARASSWADIPADAGRTRADDAGDDLLTQRSAAKLADRTTRTLRRWIDYGLLESEPTPTGRAVRRRALESFLAARAS